MGERLSALDLAFLGLETQRTPVNVAGLTILHIPTGHKGNFVRALLEELRQQPAGPPFDRRLDSITPLGPLQWVRDEHFDLDYHVRHSALPHPGRMEELLDLVSRLHSRVMDRERPLWEFHIIEGLRGRRFAIYMKMHHAAIDGMGGIQVLESCFTPDPQAPVRAPWAGLQGKPRRSYRSPSLLSRLTLPMRGLASQARLGLELGELLLGQGMKGMGLKPADSPVPFTAPKSPFNVPVSGARRFAAASVSLREIKRLCREARASVNDIVLATCAGALRRYLLEKGALPERSLVATVPVSVRQINRPGNQITYVAARLGTDERDPHRRLEVISRSTIQAKREVMEVSPAAATSFAVLAQGLVALLNRLRISGLVPPPANVTISNVPGPRKTLYFGGAELLANYPLSVLIDGQALNITVMSYRDEVDFGIMACRDAVPDVDHLASLIGPAFDELQRAFATPRRRTLADSSG